MTRYPSALATALAIPVGLALILWDAGRWVWNYVRR